MSSRKLLALDFIKRYFADWGQSPSLDEIAAALGVSKQRVCRIIDQLIAEGHLRRTAGKRRGLELVDRGQEYSEADALLRLRSMGWKIDSDAMMIGETQAPLRQAQEAQSAAPRQAQGGRLLTKGELHRLPILDHVPTFDGGVGKNHGDEAS